MPTDDCSDVLKALADRTRQRLVKALFRHDAIVNDLTGQLGLSQYNTSKHLRILKEAGIVDVRSMGQRREYYLSPSFRLKIERNDHVLDFGCCTFRVDEFPD